MRHVTRRVAATALAALCAGCAAPVQSPLDQGPPPRLAVLERAPEGGLRYRMHVVEAPARPQRLVVWLHPSGESLNERVERLAPGLARRGFALLVPTHKPFREWKGIEANQLMTRTLPDAASIPGIDGRRPILMGFSAGAQMALLLWAAAPERLGGLVLSGAAPAFLDRGRVAVRPPPEEAARAHTPVLVVAGALDRVAAVWERHAPGWTAAGVPLTMHVVPGEGHALLLDAQAQEALHRWLEER